MKLERIAIVSIPVVDQQKARAFYAETLGFEVVRDNYAPYEKVVEEVDLAGLSPGPDGLVGRDGVAIGVEIDGVVRAPSAFSITRVLSPSSTDTQEFVVPKSIPIILPIIFLQS